MQSSIEMKEIGGIKTAKFIAASDVLALADSLCDEKEFRKAKDLLRDVIRDEEGDARLAAVVLYGRTEWKAGNYREAVEFMGEHYALAEESRDEQLRAWFHAMPGAAHHELKNQQEAQFADNNAT